MSASGSADGGDSRPGKVLRVEEPPTRRHGTRLVRCMSEKGEKRVVLHGNRDEGWIDAASDDVWDLSEMR
jgi:hypothetical protein